MDINISKFELVAYTIAIISTFIGIYFWGYKKGINSKKYLRIKKRHTLLYSNLYSLFQYKHISSASTTYSYNLKSKFRYFKKYLKERSYWLALKSMLLNLRSKEVYEIEYGGKFPFDEIKNIFNDNISLADEKLSVLIKNVDRDYIESNYTERDLLSDEEVALYLYICDQFFKLSNKFNTNYNWKLLNLIKKFLLNLYKKLSNFYKDK